MVAGVALLNYDGDGYLDVYLVGGASSIPSLIKNSPVYWNRLFHNNHDGTFTDVTVKAGLAGSRYVSSVAVATTTMTAGRTSSSPMSRGISSSTTTATEPLPM